MSIRKADMLLGAEQIHHPDYSKLEKAYIALFGIPIVGLRIRARNVFSLIPKERVYHQILDAGSGPGVFSFELGRRYPESKVVGIDLLKESIQACEHISQKLNITNVRFQQSSIEELPQHNYFDLILCVDILEHIQDDLAALKGLYHAAAPGGLIVLHVPALYRRYPVWQKRMNFDVQTHVRVGYEPHEIEEKMEQSGFLICESGFTYGFWETLANNISYMITRARMQNKVLYALVFPILYLISLFGAQARPKNLGAGIFVTATKPLVDKT
jgi:SAM-dependent methyltransferase